MHRPPYAAAKQDSIWNRDFVILFIVNIVAFLGFQMVNPNITKFAAESGVASSLLGVVSGIFAAAALVSRPFAGYMTDRLNKRLLILLSLAGLIACFLGYLIVQEAAFIIAIRFLHGLCFGVNSTVSMTLASAALPTEKLSSGLGFFSVSGVASMAIAPSIGIWIVDAWGYPAMFWLSSGLTLVSLFLAFGISKEEAKPTSHGSGLKLENFFTVEALIPALICVLVSSASGACSSFMVLYGEARDIPNIGSFFTMYALAVLVARPLVGRFADRYPAAYIGIPCCLCILAAMVALWQANSLFHILLAGAFFGVGYSILPLLQSMCIKCAPMERWGAASSTYYIGLDIGNAGGPVIGGLIAASLGYETMFLTFGLPAVLGALILLAQHRGAAQPAPLNAE